MRKIFIIFLITMCPILMNAQKVFMIFNVTTGVPQELTLVDSNGVKIGYSNFYNTKGILTMSLMYENGVPNGKWSRYDDKTGNIKESFIYVSGKLNGERCLYDEYGRITKSIAYRDGVRMALPQYENTFALEFVTPADAGSSFRFMSVCPTQSYANYCAVQTNG